MKKFQEAILNTIFNGLVIPWPLRVCNEMELLETRMSEPMLSWRPVIIS